MKAAQAGFVRVATTLVAQRFYFDFTATALFLASYPTPIKQNKSKAKVLENSGVSAIALLAFTLFVLVSTKVR